jgi:hypothetical protein
VIPDLREAEQTLRDHPHLTIGPLLDPVSVNSSAAATDAPSDTRR